MVTVNIHQAINELTNQARALASTVTEAALDSCCTNKRPSSGNRKIRAWDLVNLAFKLNAISDRHDVSTADYSLSIWIALVSAA